MEKGFENRASIRVLKAGAVATLDEYSFRYNRQFSEEPMFVSLLDQVAERVNLPLAVQDL